MVSCRKTIWLFCCNLYPTYSVYLNELYSGTFTTVPTTSLIFLVFVRYKILNFHYMRRNVKSDSWLKCKACTGHPADYTRRRTLLVKTMNTLFIQKRIMVPYRGLTVAEACFLSEPSLCQAFTFDAWMMSSPSNPALADCLLKQ